MDEGISIAFKLGVDNEKIMDKQTQDRLVNKATLEAETAIVEEIKKEKLEYSELSPMMRELLGAVYLRGNHDMLNKIKKEMMGYVAPDNKDK